MNRVIIGLGSNIEPEYNIQQAKKMLAQQYRLIAESEFEQTKAVGPIQQADFINGSVCIETASTLKDLQTELKEIETRLGRKEESVRFGPRTIDLDIVVWNNEIVDQDFYEREYLRTSVLQIIPDLKCN